MKIDLTNPPDKISTGKLGDFIGTVVGEVVWWMVAAILCIGGYLANRWINWTFVYKPLVQQAIQKEAAKDTSATKGDITWPGNINR